MSVATERAPLVLHAYRRSTSPRATLGVLWELVERQGAAAKIFYAQLPEAESERGDLVEFVRYFDDPKRHLVVMLDPESGAPVGMVWFDDVVLGHRAAINIFYARRVWGERARQATGTAITWAFEAFAARAIWGYTPWRTAVHHGLALGFSIVATLPGFVRIEGAPQDVTILRLERGEWHG